MNKYQKYLVFFVSIMFLNTITVFSEIQSNKDTVKNYKLPTVSIISDRSSLLNTIPGSAVIISNKQISSMRSISGNEMIRTMTGVNVVDEEGAGLRMNLGIRGLDPDRSRSLLVLEDGIPVALAPYGEPEMYYTPSIDRMNSIELLKGSGSIIYGPQTIGGVLNYITNDPPISPETDFHFIGGSGGFVNAKIGYGASSGSTGFLTEFHHKSADKIGLTKYDIYDYMAKAKFTVNQNSALSVKIGVYNESSNSTYVGITQTMFDKKDYFVEIAPFDELNIRRYSASLNYQNIINSNTVFNTSIFAYNTSRFWRRQDFGRTSSVSNKTGVVFGDTNVVGGAIYMRNATGNRDREFDVFGIQPSLITNLNLLNYVNEIHIGFRFLIEKAYEQRINGTNFRAVSGSLIEDETRSGFALSGFLQDRIHLTNHLILTPGLRFEYFKYQREIYRLNSKDTSINSNNIIDEFIPGFGLNYNFDDHNTFFAGIHRGFAPPRTKDAITNEGAALDLSAELSWNYEIGIRSSLNQFAYFEVTAYMLDFTNQIIPVSESSGNIGFGLINGGKTLHRGIEFSIMTDLNKIFDMNSTLIWSFNTTISQSKFNSDRFLGTSKQNITGNSLPYAPNFVLSSMIQYRMKSGLGITFNTAYIGEQFTDEFNTLSPSQDGTTGKMDSYYLFDITFLYAVGNSSDIFFSVKNLTDEVYVASRRPQGIKVGIPRFFTAGLDYHF